MDQEKQDTGVRTQKIQREREQRKEREKEKNESGRREEEKETEGEGGQTERERSENGSGKEGERNTCIVGGGITKDNEALSCKTLSTIAVASLQITCTLAS